MRIVLFGAGLPFHALRGDVQQMMAGETGQKYMLSVERRLHRRVCLSRRVSPGVFGCRCLCWARR